MVAYHGSLTAVRHLLAHREQLGINELALQLLPRIAVQADHSAICVWLPDNSEYGKPGYEEALLRAVCAASKKGNMSTLAFL